jgi:hypothetical protein
VTTNILALDVTEQARAAGVDRVVALSVGILASFNREDEDSRNADIGAFVRLVLEGDHARIDVGPGAYVVEVKGRQMSRRFMVTERPRSTDGQSAIGILSLVEAQLAGEDMNLDVRVRGGRRMLQ